MSGRFYGADGLEAWVENGKLKLNRRFDKRHRPLGPNETVAPDGTVIDDLHDGTKADVINGRLYLYAPQENTSSAVNKRKMLNTRKVLREAFRNQKK